MNQKTKADAKCTMMPPIGTIGLLLMSITLFELQHTKINTVSLIFEYTGIEELRKQLQIFYH